MSPRRRPRPTSGSSPEELTEADLELLRPLARRARIDDMAEQLRQPATTTEEDPR